MSAMTSQISGLCEGNSPVTGEFPAKRARNVENVSIWWRHHDLNSRNLQDTFNLVLFHGVYENWALCGNSELMLWTFLHGSNVFLFLPKFTLLRDLASQSVK